VEKNYEKEAWQAHLVYHNLLEGMKGKTNQIEADVREKQSILRDIEEAENLFDTVIMWVENLQKEVYMLQGQIRELEKLAVLRHTTKRNNPGSQGIKVVVEFKDEEEFINLIVDLVHVAHKLYVEDDKKAYPVLKALAVIAKGVDIEEILKVKKNEGTEETGPADSN